MNASSDDIANTGVGWLLLRVVLPLALIAWGSLSILTQSIHLRSAEVTGIAAVGYGIGVFLIGMATFCMPTVSQVMSPKFATELLIRFSLLVVALFGIIFGAVITLA